MNQPDSIRRVTLAGIPPWVLLFATVGLAFLVLPLLAMLTRVNWTEFPSLVTSESSLAALKLSLSTAAISTLICLILGLPLALLLARVSFPGRAAVRVLILLPLVLPPVVSGIALLYTFGRRGLVGEHLEVFGIQIAFSTVAVILAQTFVSLPFLVITIEGALRTSGEKYEAIAATLGAPPSTILRRITVPLVLPGIFAGAVLAFARGLGEFGATLTFAGSIQGVTRTLPLEIYLQRESDTDAAIALSVVLMLVAAAVILLTHHRGKS